MAYFLTIDDGVSEDAVSKIDYLNQQSIKSVWFCIGQNLAKNPDAALHLIKSGHILANHSLSHPHFSRISLDDAKKEIAETEKLIEEIYRLAAIVRPAKLFRFPYGDQGQYKDGKISSEPERVGHRKEIQEYLQELEFSQLPADRYEYMQETVSQPTDRDWLWSYDIQEWAIGHETGFKLTYEEVEKNLQKFLIEHDRDLNQIILIHDHTYTSQYFEKIIGLFLQAGIKFDDPSVLIS